MSEQSDLSATSTSISTSSGGGPAVSDFLPEPSKIDPQLLLPLTNLGIDSLAPFLAEYSKLQLALQKSSESEQRFLLKCKSLTKQTRAHQHKLIALQSIHSSDLKKRKQLMDDIEKDKLSIQRVNEELLSKKDQINSVKTELQLLSESLESNSTNRLIEQKSEIVRLEGDIQRLSVQRDKDRNNLTKLRTSNIEKFEQLQSLLMNQSRSQAELDNLDSKLLESKALSGKELRRKAELELRLKEYQQRVLEQQSVLSIKKELIIKAEKELNEVQQQLIKSEMIVKNHESEYNELSIQATRENELLISVQDENESTIEYYRKESKELELLKSTNKSLKQQLETKIKMLEIMNIKLNEITNTTRIEEEEKLTTINSIKLNKELIAAAQYKLNSNNKSMDTCIREREVLSSNHTAKIQSIKSKETALKIRSASLKNIQNEHSGYLNSIRNLTKIIEKLNNSKSRHEIELQRRLEQKSAAAIEVELREIKINEFQQNILINEGRYRQQLNLLESVRSDRNYYRKQLIEQSNEMNEMKRKFQLSTTLVKSLKSEISDKDHSIIVEHFNSQSVQDDITALKTQNSALKINLTNTETEIKQQQLNIRQLSTIISDADSELKVQIKQYNSILNEQRVLNQQLIGRNQELSSLYEELKLSNNQLSGNSQYYREKLLLYHSLQDNTAALSEQLNNVLTDISQYNELKSTIELRKSNLLDEELKIKSLSDELKKPINIHRWRKLQDTNTETYLMIKKIRSLQKSIINKQSAVESKENSIAEKEKLYVDLRKILSRQPGPDTERSIAIFNEQLIEKKSKLKQINSELNLYQQKSKEYQYDINSINNQIKLLKFQYFQSRRKQQQKNNNQNNQNNYNQNKLYNNYIQHQQQNISNSNNNIGLLTSGQSAGIPTTNDTISHNGSNTNININTDRPDSASQPTTATTAPQQPIFHSAIAARIAAESQQQYLAEQAAKSKAEN